MRNIGVILNHFTYFFAFPAVDNLHRYYFLTARKRFGGKQDGSLTYCDWRNSSSAQGTVSGDPEYFLAIARRLRAVPAGVDEQRVLVFYQQCVERFLESNHIDALLTGGTTVFERVGLETARRLGVPAMCVWEGLFRPDTISIDPQGMNSNSAFRGKAFHEIRKHESSRRFGDFWRRYSKTVLNGPIQNSDLRAIQGSRFDVRKQAINRWVDRGDFDRVRVPMHQHARARLSYYGFKQKYTRLSDLRAPFVIFPLQTHTDTNVVLDAPFFPYERNVEAVLSAFASHFVNGDVQLVIKEHPLDVFRKSYSREQTQVIKWLRPETSLHAVLRHPLCKACVVVNSTAGLESLSYGKPVLCLGKSIYDYGELVEKAENHDMASIGAALRRLTERKVDERDILRFCGALYDNTQVDGNLENIPDRDTVSAFFSVLKGSNG